jgi:hypothetical protein
MLRRTFAKTAFSLFTGAATGSRLVEQEPTRLFPFDFGLVIGGEKQSVHPEEFTVDFARMHVHITIAYKVTKKGMVTHAYLDKLDKVELFNYDLEPGDTLHCTLIFNLTTKKFFTWPDPTRYFRLRPRYPGDRG